jgi:hypothetical protein
MRKLTFYGASDDLFEIEGTKGDEPDELGSYGSPSVVIVGNEQEGLRISAIYGSHVEGFGGCWAIAIGLRDEDEPLPSWPMTWGISRTGYSVMLVLEVPDDAVVAEAKS